MAWTKIYLRTKWQLDPSSGFQPFGQNRHGPKIKGCAPSGEELGPRIIQCGRVEPNSMPSFISSIFIQYTNVTGRTDNGANATANGEPFYKRSPKYKWIMEREGPVVVMEK